MKESISIDLIDDLKLVNYIYRFAAKYGNCTNILYGYCLFMYLLNFYHGIKIPVVSVSYCEKIKVSRSEIFMVSVDL